MTLAYGSIPRTTDKALLIDHFNAFPPATRVEFDVTDAAYGAVGDDGTGTVDDTAAFQAAITAAIAVRGTLRIPQAPSGRQWRITDALVIEPADGDTQVRLDIMAGGNYADIIYDGAAGGSVFVVSGLKQSTIKGLKVHINHKHDVTVWDLRCTDGAASLSSVLWQNCHVSTGHGGACTGWRSIPRDDAAGDFAMLKWDSCTVTGEAYSYGDIGWRPGTGNSTPWVWVNSGASLVRSILVDGPLMVLLTGAGIASTGATTVTVESTLGFPNTGTIKVESEQITYTGLTSTTFTGCTRGANSTTAATHAAGIAVYQLLDAADGQVCAGCPDKHFWACGGSSNYVDYELTAGGSYSFRDLTSEQPVRLLHAGIGVSGAMMNITLDTPTVRGATGDDILIRARFPVSLDISNPQITSTARMYATGMITIDCASPSYSSVKVEGGYIRATDPFYTFANATNAANAGLDIGLVTRLDASFLQVGRFAVLRKDTVRETWGTTAPASGTWTRGDITWNSSPSAAGAPGWLCTTSGTPGTWKAMASLAA